VLYDSSFFTLVFFGGFTRRPKGRAKNENECDVTLKIFLLLFSFSFFALKICSGWKRHGTLPAGYGY
jgi:hypothetical protein